MQITELFIFFITQFSHTDDRERRPGARDVKKPRGVLPQGTHTREINNVTAHGVCLYDAVSTEL